MDFHDLRGPADRINSTAIVQAHTVSMAWTAFAVMNGSEKAESFASAVEMVYPRINSALSLPLMHSKVLVTLQGRN